jgi:hypothetical protein
MSSASATAALAAAGPADGQVRLKVKQLSGNELHITVSATVSNRPCFRPPPLCAHIAEQSREWWAVLTVPPVYAYVCSASLLTGDDTGTESGDCGCTERCAGVSSAADLSGQSPH